MEWPLEEDIKKEIYDQNVRESFEIVKIPD